MFKSIFTKESFQMFRDKKLMIALTAILFVPVLYAGMFLWAFWDPYDKLDDIPVAIVNDDEGYYFRDEWLHLGDELIDNLEDEDAFDFHIVDRKTGYDGLENEDYYVLIEIPSTFSEHATTVIDENPEKIELVYTPNESYNFLAAQIGETAMLQIEAALEEKVTEAYANAIVDNFDTVIDKVNEAKDGVDELHDGAKQLHDGTDELETHLFTLASSTITFADGLQVAKEGVNTLQNGSMNLATGMLELFENSEKLTKASNELTNGANDLSNGLQTAHNGMNQLEKNIPTLIDGTDQLAHSFNELEQQLPKVLASEIEVELNKQADTIIAGTNELRNGIVNGLENELADQLIDGLSSGLAEAMKSELGDLNIDIPDEVSEQIAHDISQLIYEEKVAQTEKLSVLLKENGVDDATIEAVANALNQDSNTEIEQKIEQVLSTSLTAVRDKIGSMDHMTDQVEQQVSQSVDSQIRHAISLTVGGVNAGFDQFEAELTTGVANAADGLDEQIAQALQSPIQRLQNGTRAIHNGQIALQQGVNELSSGSAQLVSGAKELSSSQQQYFDNISRFTNNVGIATNGANELNDGVNALHGGVKELADGSSQLVDGTAELADGASKLKDGMGELRDGTETFQKEVGSLTDHTNDVSLSKKTSAMVSDPVEVQYDSLNEVPNYGTGFAPYFLSLGLFVGALLLSIVYPLREPSVMPTSGVNWFLRKFLVIFAIGIIQALIASFVLLFGLRIEVQSVPLFLLFAIITSLTFITLIQFLVTCFDDPGRFIAIIILILQLTTSAGTFPLEVIPDALKPFNSILPMTYSVHGFKAVISSGDFLIMWKNVGVLLLFTVISMALTLSYFMKMYNRKFGKLQNTTA